jgi:hypothetical protein
MSNFTPQHARNSISITQRHQPIHRQNTTAPQKARVATAKQAHEKNKPVVQPPAKNTNPDANDAPAK